MQVVLIAALGAIGAAVTILLAAAVIDRTHHASTDSTMIRALSTIQDQLRTEHKNFWRNVAEGGRPELSPTGLLLARQGPAMIRGLIAADRHPTPAKRAIQQELLELSTAYTQRLQTRSPGPGTFRSPATQRLIRDSDESISRITTLFQRWIRIEQASLTDSLDDAGSVARGGATAVIATIAAGTLIAAILSLLLNRSRPRMVSALADAAERLSDRAETDGLTGLANHASFQGRLRDAVANAHRSGQPLGLVLIDLDHFKRVNDAFGHPVGDRVLVECARLLAHAAGDGDLVARIGGEEFAWARPGADVGGCVRDAERLREAVAAAVIGPVRGMTISSGVCGSAAGRDAAELIRLADGALYWAKEHGRNLTVPYSPEVMAERADGTRAERLERFAAITTVRALAKAVDAKDASTQRHSERVGELAREIAIELGWDDRRTVALFEAALVHDVGKIGIPDRVLKKPGRLDGEEMALMRTHPALGAQIVTGVLDDEQVSWIRAHHERIDGTGYPERLAGERIPDGARILAVADAWDAMTGTRPYSSPRTTADALAECRRCRGTQFEPAVVDALGAVMVRRAASPVAAPPVTA